MNYINFDNLKINLANESNKDLITKFFYAFDKFGAFEPGDENEKIHVLETSKIYIDEIKARVNNYFIKRNSSAIIELAKLFQDKLKNNRLQGNEDFSPYAIRNCLRIYSYCINKLQKMDMDKKELRKEFL